MTLSEILQDIHALQEDLLIFERKYNILSEIFYASYIQGEEPSDDAWVLDWAGWVETYQIWVRHRQQYLQAIEALEQQMPLIQIIEKAMRRESLPVPA